MSIITFKDYRLLCDGCGRQFGEPVPSAAEIQGMTKAQLRRDARRAGWSCVASSLQRPGSDRCPACQTGGE